MCYSISLSPSSSLSLFLSLPLSLSPFLSLTPNVPPSLLSPSFLSPILLPSTFAHSPGLAYDTVDYLLENTERLHVCTNIFTRYFPNILKVSILQYTVTTLHTGGQYTTVYCNNIHTGGQYTTVYCNNIHTGGQYTTVYCNNITYWRSVYYDDINGTLPLTEDLSVVTCHICSRVPTAAARLHLQDISF